MIDIDNLTAEITKYRRDLHQIPELGFFVYKTNAYVRNLLSELSCSVEPIAKTGLVAFFDFGKEQSICFRADMLFPFHVMNNVRQDTHRELF